MPRRLITLLTAAALIGAPAAVLRALCVGRACERPEGAAAEVPFCSLPSHVRDPLVAGFREDRSPEILAVAGRSGVVGPGGASWPSLRSGPARVPIAFAGTGVRGDAAIPSGTGLDDVAPTIAEVIGLHRAHPEVRSGKAIEEVATGRAPRLVLEVVLKNVGSADLAAARGRWPHLRSLMSRGAATLRAEAGSLPLDPAATITTIGTGGLPRQHGITGSLVRNDSGKLTPAWGEGSPLSVIATLGDDLDQRLHQRPAVGLVATDTSDRGVIGGNWYVDTDRDLVEVVPGRQLETARSILEDDHPGSDEGAAQAAFGRDRVPDLLAVILDGDIAAMDRELGGLVDVARRVSRGSVAVAVTATGSSSGASKSAVASSAVVREVESHIEGRRRVVEGVSPGGLFLDEHTVAAESISSDEVTSVLREMGGSRGEPLFADSFSALAVSFARYC